MEIGVVDYAVYEDGDEFIGIAEVTLPTKNQKVIALEGAGIGGTVNVPIRGQYDAMEMSLKFRTYSEKVARLREARRHNLDLRIAQQNEDPVTGTMKVVTVKHVLVVVPASQSAGNIKPASPTDTEVKVMVRYWATFVDNKKVEEIDPFNRVDIVNGIDQNAPVRKALGQ